jgi:hypothetical protein
MRYPGFQNLGFQMLQLVPLLRGWAVRGGDDERAANLQHEQGGTQGADTRHARLCHQEEITVKRMIFLFFERSSVN